MFIKFVAPGITCLFVKFGENLPGLFCDFRGDSQMEMTFLNVIMTFKKVHIVIPDLKHCYWSQLYHY